MGIKYPGLVRVARVQPVLEHRVGERHLASSVVLSVALVPFWKGHSWHSKLENS